MPRVLAPLPLKVARKNHGLTWMIVRVLSADSNTLSATNEIEINNPDYNSPAFSLLARVRRPARAPGTVAARNRWSAH